jgi:hypothetical protein
MKVFVIALQSGDTNFITGSQNFIDFLRTKIPIVNILGMYRKKMEYLDFEKGFKWLNKNTAENELAIVYVSCHGHKQETIQYNIDVREITKLLICKNVLFLFDVCYIGSEWIEKSYTTNWVCISSSSKLNKSYFFKDKGGVFTQAMMKVLNELNGLSYIQFGMCINIKIKSIIDCQNISMSSSNVGILDKVFEIK